MHEASFGFLPSRLFISLSHGEEEDEERGSECDSLICEEEKSRGHQRERPKGKTLE